MRTRTAAPGSRRLVRRTVQLFAGLVLYGFSMALMVVSGLGLMPWDVLHQGVSERSGWTMGSVTIVTGAVVLLCWLPLRQRPGFGTVANVVVIGVALDAFLLLLRLLPELALGWRIAMLAAGVVLNGVATAAYIGARMGPGPRDGLMTGLVARTGWSTAVVRTGIEVLVVLSGWALGGTFGVGTIAYALGIGPLVQIFLPRLTVPVSPGAAPGAPEAGASGPDASGRPASPRT